MLSSLKATSGKDVPLNTNPFVFPLVQKPQKKKRFLEWHQRQEDTEHKNVKVWHIRTNKQTKQGLSDILHPSIYYPEGVG